MAGAAAVPALMGGGDDGYDSILRGLEHSSQRSFDSAQMGIMNSQELFKSILPYINAVAGGDRQALLGATMPERKRVIDQYATARRSLGEFAPRSGGTAGALAGMNAQQASDLSLIGANARNAGIGTAANVAGGLASQAASAEALGNNSLANMSSIINSRNQQSSENAAQWGQALGMIAMMAML